MLTFWRYQGQIEKSLAGVVLALFVMAVQSQAWAQVGVPLPYPKPRLPQAQVPQAQTPQTQTQLNPVLTASLPPPPPKPKGIGELEDRTALSEALPERLQGMWLAYQNMRDIKAMAITHGGQSGRQAGAISVAHTSVRDATEGALTACAATARRLQIDGACKIFAVGAYVVINAPTSYEQAAIRRVSQLEGSGRVGKGPRGQVWR